MTTPVRAALCLRVSTGRQADSDLSIPDQRRQARSYCASRGWEIVADYVEPGVSANDDRRPEFQRMIDAATTKPPAFDVIVAHSFICSVAFSARIKWMLKGFPVRRSTSRFTCIPSVVAALCLPFAPGKSQPFVGP